MKKLALCCVVSMFLFGCKATIETSVKLSDLNNKDVKTVNGYLYAEVVSCHSHEDSRIPSESLTKAKNLIPMIFEGAKFKECFSKSLDSYSLFEIPIAINRGELKDFDKKYVGVTSDEEIFLGVNVPRKIKDGIDKHIKENGSLPFDLSINIKLLNDSGDKLPVTVLSSFVDGSPFIFKDIEIKKGMEPPIFLSDTAVAEAIRYGYTPVLFKRT